MQEERQEIGQRNLEGRKIKGAGLNRKKVRREGQKENEGNIRAGE